MTPQEREYSAMARDADAFPDRPLPIALAHCLAAAKPDTDRMRLLNKLYLALTWGEQAACRGELARCRAARAGRLEAKVGEDARIDTI